MKAPLHKPTDPARSHFSFQVHICYLAQEKELTAQAKRMNIEYEIVDDTTVHWERLARKLLCALHWLRLYIKLKRVRVIQRAWYHCKKRLGKITGGFRKQLTEHAHELRQAGHDLPTSVFKAIYRKNCCTNIHI